MKAELKEINSNTRQLIVIVENERAQKDYQKVFNKVYKNIQIPGFRKGKAPVKYVESSYKQYITEEYFDKYAGEYYKEALDVSNAKPITQGHLININWDNDQEAVLTFEFKCFPEKFDVNYKNLEVPFKELEKNVDAEVEANLQSLREANATQEPLDENGVVGVDCEVTISFSLAEESHFINLDNPLTLTVGKSAEVIGTDFDEKVIGKKINDVFEVNFVHQHDDEIITETVEVKIEDAFFKTLPLLDDAFALSMDYESLEAMKAKLTSEAEAAFEMNNMQAIEQAIITALIKNNPLDIPDEYYIRNGQYMLEKQYNSSLGNISEDILLNFGKIYSEMQTVFELVAERIKEVENIEITDADVDNYLEIILKNDDKTVEEYKENYKHVVENEDFKTRVMQHKVLEIVKSTMVIVEPKMEEEIIETPVANDGE